MDILFPYLIKSLVASGVLYLYYLVALRNKKFHAYNRFYLLGSVAFSLLVPFIHFSWNQLETTQSNPFNGFLIALNDNTAGYRSGHEANIGMIVLSIMVVGSFFLLLALISKIAWIYKVKRAGKTIRRSGYDFIETPSRQAPFSFLKNHFWKEGMSLTDAYGKKIFTHELTHIRQGHSYDKLFSQLALSLVWVNPFYWLIQSELSAIHEFIADSESIAEGDTGSFAMMLLQSHNDGRYLHPSNPLHTVSPQEEKITTVFRSAGTMRAIKERCSLVSWEND